MYQKQKVIVYDKHVCDKNKNILCFDKHMITKNKNILFQANTCLPSEKWWIKNGSKTFVYQNKNICV